MRPKFYRKRKFFSYATFVEFASEFMGTAMLLFFGCMSCAGLQNVRRTIIEMGMGWAFTIVIAVQAFGHLSGAHINPVVTIAACILGYLPLINGIVYICAQFSGALFGYGFLWVVTPRVITAPVYRVNVKGEMYRTVAGLCSSGLYDLTEWQGILVESALSFTLIWTVCAIWDRKNSHKLESVPLRLGCIVGGLVITSIHYTGCHMNPARTLAPALINGDWNDHWIYWIGEFSGGLLSVLIYSIFFNTPPGEADLDTDDE